MIIIIPFEKIYEEDVRAFVKGVTKEMGRTNVSRANTPDLYDIYKNYQEKNGNFWIALDNGEVVGTLGLQNMGRARGYLERMYVKNESRRQGIGSRLFNELLMFLTDERYQEIYLETSKTEVSSKNFYTKMGFRKIKSFPDDFEQIDNVDYYHLKIR